MRTLCCTLRFANFFSSTRLHTLWPKRPGVGALRGSVSQVSLEVLPGRGVRRRQATGLPLLLYLITSIRRSSGMRRRRGSRRLQQLPRILSNISLAKNGVARNEQFGARAHHVADRVHRYAAVHFNPEIQPALLSLIRQRGDFLQRIADKFLS